MPKLGPPSGNLDIEIEDGVDYPLAVIYKTAGTAVDVTGYTATFTLNDYEGESKTPLLQLTELSGITVGTTDGTFTVTIDSTQAVWGDRKMVYDLVITSPSLVPTRLLSGICQSHARAHQ